MRLRAASPGRHRPAAGTTFKAKLTELTLIPDSGGCFEVTVGDELVYSKLATEEFPEPATLIEEVRRRLPA